MSTLEIKDLHVSVETEIGPKEILKGVDLTVRSGETHAIMGPNGSGKSTLAYSIAGHPKYQITSGTVTLDGADVLAMGVDERAQAGLFLAMQYPVEVPGVSVSNFLRTAKTAIDGEAPKLRHWVKDVKAAMGRLKMDSTFAERDVNAGFSGGEKKRHEILQMELLKPKVAILDETDSGLDIDALRVVSEGVNRAKDENDLGSTRWAVKGARCPDPSALARAVPLTMSSLVVVRSGTSKISRKGKSSTPSCGTATAGLEVMAKCTGMGVVPGPTNTGTPWLRMRRSSCWTR